ncbi:hypothetical protein M0811_10393 [Anaeramoeba ignava]|uniref:Uncharacterized protein n=1 Tax=Anaeramoeba ignava TaxID=1746090 RepID=A0A9Q0LDS9_ANAIG|nr:hypothetical protein M0811_10393 [Anaeramoeba ignava]
MELIKELSEQSELTKYKLSDFVKENLTKDETKPFTDSKEFFDAVTSFLVLSFISFEEINFPVTLFEKNSQPKNFPAHVQWIEHTRKLKEKMKEIIFKKVELMPNKPIVARYKDKIKLTDKEFLLLSCLVLSSIGFSIPNAMRFYSLEGLSTMGLFGDMTPFELINFVSPTRGHMKDRMFKNGIESYGYMRMEPQFVAALFDQDLSEEQMLSLQGTNLGAVFEERKKEKEDEKKNGEEKIELAKNELEKIDQEK